MFVEVSFFFWVEGGEIAKLGPLAAGLAKAAWDEIKKFINCLAQSFTLCPATFRASFNGYYKGDYTMLYRTVRLFKGYYKGDYESVIIKGFTEGYFTGF